MKHHRHHATVGHGSGVVVTDWAKFPVVIAFADSQQRLPEAVTETAFIELAEIPQIDVIGPDEPAASADQRPAQVISDWQRMLQQVNAVDVAQAASLPNGFASYDIAGWVVEIGHSDQFDSLADTVGQIESNF